MACIWMEVGEVLCLTLDGREKLSATLRKMECFFRIKLIIGWILRMTWSIIFWEVSRNHSDIKQQNPQQC